MSRHSQSIFSLCTVKKSRSKKIWCVLGPKAPNNLHQVLRNLVLRNLAQSVMFYVENAPQVFLVLFISLLCLVTLNLFFLCVKKISKEKQNRLLLRIAFDYLMMLICVYVYLVVNRNSSSSSAYKVEDHNYHAHDS